MEVPMTQPAQFPLSSPAVAPVLRPGTCVSEFVCRVSQPFEVLPARERSGELLPIGAILGQLLRNYDLALPHDAATRPSS